MLEKNLNLLIFTYPIQGTSSIHPSGGTVHSGANILISGLCYHPGADVLCDFGKAGPVVGWRINETKAFCSVPLTTTRNQVTLLVSSSKDAKSKLAQVFDLGECLNVNY